MYFYEGKGWGFLAGVLRGILSIPAGMGELRRRDGGGTGEVQWRYKRATLEVQGNNCRYWFLAHLHIVVLMFIVDFNKYNNNISKIIIVVMRL